MQAWDARENDYDACIVSHYVARLQKTPADVLHWNQESLNYADKVGDARVAAFYPSLYLNLGKAHEDLGNKEEARKYYQLAAEKLSILPEGNYGDIVKQGVSDGLKRVAPMPQELNQEAAWPQILDALASGDMELAKERLWPPGAGQDWFSGMGPRMEFAGGGYERSARVLAVFCYEQALHLYEAECSGASSGGEGLAQMNEMRGRDLGRKIWLLKS